MTEYAATTVYSIEIDNCPLEVTVSHSNRMATSIYHSRESVFEDCDCGDYLDCMLFEGDMQPGDISVFSVVSDGDHHSISHETAPAALEEGENIVSIHTIRVISVVTTEGE